MVKITKAFPYAYNGIRVVQIAEGAELADDDQAAVCALREKWGKKIKATKADAEAAKPAEDAGEDKPPA